MNAMFFNYNIYKLCYFKDFFLNLFKKIKIKFILFMEIRVVFLSTYFGNSTRAAVLGSHYNMQ